MYIKPFSLQTNFFNFKEQLISPLTPFQKVILFIASLAFSCLAAIYLYSKCNFKENKEKVIKKLEKVDMTLDPLQLNSSKVETQYDTASIKPLSLIDEQIKTLKAFKDGLKNLPQGTSHVYVDVSFKGKNDKQYTPGWYTQTEISAASGFTSQILQQKAEIGFGPFLFVSSFGNAHDHIKMLEPQIVLPSPFPDDPEGAKIEFHHVEFYYQFAKRIILLSEGKENKEALMNDIKNNTLFRPVNGPAVAQGYGNAKKLSSSGWQFFENNQVAIMTDAIFAKFSQHPLLGEMLKETDPHLLLQLKTDKIWGPGAEGNGQNLLGVCLMNVRKALLEGKVIKSFDIQAELKKTSLERF